MRTGYMIQRKSTGHFVTVSKDKLVTIPDSKKCLKFHDEKSAMIFMHFMITTMNAIATEYTIGMEHNLALPQAPGKNMMSIDNKKGKGWFK